MMKEIYKRQVVSLSIFLIFITVSTTGTVMYLTPFNKTIASLHTIFGILFIIFSLFHFTNNILSLKNYILKKKKVSFVFLAVMTALLGVFLVIFYGKFKSESIYDWGNAYRNSQLGKQVLDDGTQNIILSNKVDEITIEFDVKKGKAFGYPLMAMWIEDEKGDYVQSLFVPKSIASSEFNYGNEGEPDFVRRPEAIPYWAHKRGVKAADGLYIPLGKAYDIDAVSGATPTSDFIIKSKANLGKLEKFKVLMEINQSYDWNEFYSKNKFPNDKIYSGSGQVGQPAIVYSVDVDLNQIKSSKNYLLEAVGHSHHSGKTGDLYADMSNITTALEIIDRGIVKITK